jgi:hypothetical protein
VLNPRESKQSYPSFTRRAYNATTDTTTCPKIPKEKFKEKPSGRKLKIDIVKAKEREKSDLDVEFDEINRESGGGVEGRDRVLFDGFHSPIRRL